MVNGGYIVDQNEVKHAHKILLELLREFHDFCQKNKLQYYIIGGTLLGAVRHQGFIPWDIDADVAMPREDYERMIDIIVREFPEEYLIQNITTQPLFHTPKTKILVRGVRKDNPDKYMINSETGLNLDVFPLDVAPLSQAKRRAQRATIKFYKILLRFKIRYHINAYSRKEKLLRLIRNLLNSCLSIVSEKQLVSLMTSEMTRYNGSESTLWCSMASHYDYHKQVMPKEFYGTGTPINFGGATLIGPDMTHKYLHQIYGDYMKVPSLEARQKQYKDLKLSIDEGAKDTWK